MPWTIGHDTAGEPGGAPRTRRVPFRRRLILASSRPYRQAQQAMDQIGISISLLARVDLDHPCYLQSWLAAVSSAGVSVMTDPKSLTARAPRASHSVERGGSPFFLLLCSLFRVCCLSLWRAAAAVMLANRPWSRNFNSDRQWTGRFVNIPFATVIDCVVNATWGPYSIASLTCGSLKVHLGP
jgi:hypothetical protein